MGSSRLSALLPTGWSRPLVTLASMVCLTIPARASAELSPAATNPGTPTPPAPLAIPDGPRVRISPLLGAGVPIGNVGRATRLGDIMPTPLLLGADLAWGPFPSLDIGITSLAMIGLGTPARCPEPTAKCSLAVGGFGLVRGRYYLSPFAAFDPWFGLATGIEVIGSNGQTTVGGGGLLETSTTTTVSEFYFGPVFALLQAGFDYRLSRPLSLGAALAFTLAQSTNLKRTTEVDGQRTSSASSSNGGPLHSWILLTTHATFDIPL